ncbi:uncharacterized protein LOC134532247 [Bacillus rossius redtenbacheri]|uniref:uncharacterized protein LOC134532247 n=1 Tax=Bacillus rossius redtenbacheri TaxID=93214 RepID=UPI002FDE0E50
MGLDVRPWRARWTRRQSFPRRQSPSRTAYATAGCEERVQPQPAAPPTTIAHRVCYRRLRGTGTATISRATNHHRAPRVLPPAARSGYNHNQPRHQPPSRTVCATAGCEERVHPPPAVPPATIAHRVCYRRLRGAGTTTISRATNHHRAPRMLPPAARNGYSHHQPRHQPPSRTACATAGCEERVQPQPAAPPTTIAHRVCYRRLRGAGTTTTSRATNHHRAPRVLPPAARSGYNHNQPRHQPPSRTTCATAGCEERVQPQPAAPPTTIAHRVCYRRLRGAGTTTTSRATNHHRAPRVLPPAARSGYNHNQPRHQPPSRTACATAGCEERVQPQPAAPPTTIAHRVCYRRLRGAGTTTTSRATNHHRAPRVLPPAARSGYNHNQPRHQPPSRTAYATAGCEERVQPQPAAPPTTIAHRVCYRRLRGAGTTTTSRATNHHRAPRVLPPAARSGYNHNQPRHQPPSRTACATAGCEERVQPQPAAPPTTIAHRVCYRRLRGAGTTTTSRATNHHRAPRVLPPAARSGYNHNQPRHQPPSRTACATAGCEERVQPQPAAPPTTIAHRVCYRRLRGAGTTTTSRATNHHRAPRVLPPAARSGYSHHQPRHQPPSRTACATAGCEERVQPQPAAPPTTIAHRVCYRRLRGAGTTTTSCATNHHRAPRVLPPAARSGYNHNQPRHQPPSRTACATAGCEERVQPQPAAPPTTIAHRVCYRRLRGAGTTTTSRATNHHRAPRVLPPAARSGYNHNQPRHQPPSRTACATAGCEERVQPPPAAPPATIAHRVCYRRLRGAGTATTSRATNHHRAPRVLPPAARSGYSHHQPRHQPPSRTACATAGCEERVQPQPAAPPTTIAHRVCYRRLRGAGTTTTSRATNHHRAPRVLPPAARSGYNHNQPRHQPPSRTACATAGCEERVQPQPAAPPTTIAHRVCYRRLRGAGTTTTSRATNHHRAPRVLPPAARSGYNHNQPRHQPPSRTACATAGCEERVQPPPAAPPATITHRVCYRRLRGAGTATISRATSHHHAPCVLPPAARSGYNHHQPRHQPPSRTAYATAGCEERV